MIVISPTAPRSRSSLVRAAVADAGALPAGAGASIHTTKRPRTSSAPSHFGSEPFSRDPAKTTAPAAAHSAPARTLAVNICGNENRISPAGPETRRNDRAGEIVVTSTGSSWK